MGNYLKEGKKELPFLTLEVVEMTEFTRPCFFFFHVHRFATEWEELQASLDQLPEARIEAWSFYPRRGRDHLGSAFPLRQQVRNHIQHAEGNLVKITSQVKWTNCPCPKYGFLGGLKLSLA